ncbi:DUF429 domain-containing protein [Aeromicrobium sp. CF4.19]|uniref:DUF429 domain-containing protein n=1 Tax=Aeromicrobium sp. CF4.19 TaxID=3373082 RepID=UPI003EE766D3
MHFVGLDLAWGEKKPSGLAVLDDAGRLVHLSAVGDDAAILDALRPWDAGPCLVAIDAPLVVTNPTGNRPAEKALNRDFARFDAGAHPTNTGKPEFAAQPRGARVAALLDLDLDPGSSAARRAVEVYPHAASVALFRLGRTLKYKNKPGRALPHLQAQLLRLTALLESLADAEVPLDLTAPVWRELVRSVEAATRKSQLRVAEDQVDAVLCAYVAMLAHHRPDEMTTYGDARSGCIVTPRLPDGHEPTPREPVPEVPTAEVAPPTLSTPREQTGPVHRAVQEYAAVQPRLAAVTTDLVETLTTLLDDAGINYLSIDGRAKSVASFATKATRETDGHAVFTDPLRQITDQIGLRIITYVHSDVAAVADLLADQLTVLDDRDMGEETASEGRFGYASRHLLVTHPSLEGRSAQVQVRTVLQHAWAEFEHDIRYKGTVPEAHASDLDRRFTLAAGLLELADREFSTIRDRLRAGMAAEHPDVDPRDPRLSAQELAAFLATQYSDAGWSRTDHYAWVSGLLLELGITSLEELRGLLVSVDSDAVNLRMDYRYPPGAVRRLDDALLAVFEQRYVELHGNAHRQPLLQARLERLRTPPG